MKISIQVKQDKPWDQTAPVTHEVENTSEACAIAYAVSKHFGCVTVRMVYIQDEHGYKGTLLDYVCRCSGSYIQSKP
jgi:hypothetical protein